MADPAETADVAGGDELEARRQRRRTAPANPVVPRCAAAAAEVIPMLAWRSRSEQRARLLNRIQEMLRPD